MEKKVIAYLQGGLGNQCFVYAMARALALRTHAKLEFDLRCFSLDKVFRRHLSLDAFRCCLEGSVLPSLLHCKMWNVLRLKCPRALRLMNYVNERDTDCTERMDNFSGTIRLDGYWQSEKYFYDCRDQIVSDFKLKDETWLASDLIAKEIRDTPESTFLHVRSYKDIPGKTDGSAALKVNYYAAAIPMLKSLCPSASKIFLFSDDLPWALDRIRPIADSNGISLIPVGLDTPSSQLRDFTLMRLCKHGIVANSSYSWWAGWLGEQEWLGMGGHPIRVCASTGMDGAFWPERWMQIRI